MCASLRPDKWMPFLVVYFIYCWDVALHIFIMLCTYLIPNVSQMRDFHWRWWLFNNNIPMTSLLQRNDFGGKEYFKRSSVTLTSLGSWCGSWLLGSLSLWTIHGCLRTCFAVSLWWGSTWSILDTRSWREHTLIMKTYVATDADCGYRSGTRAKELPIRFVALPWQHRTPCPSCLQSDWSDRCLSCSGSHSGCPLVRWQME